MTDCKLWNAIEDAVEGRWMPTGRESEDDLRMLGYAAELRDALSPDPTGNLLRLMAICNAHLPDDAPLRDYADIKQARWGAPRPLTGAAGIPAAGAQDSIAAPKAKALAETVIMDAPTVAAAGTTTTAPVSVPTFAGAATQA